MENITFSSSSQSKLFFSQFKNLNALQRPNKCLEREKLQRAQLGFGPTKREEDVKEDVQITQEQLGQRAQTDGNISRQSKVRGGNRSASSTEIDDAITEIDGSQKRRRMDGGQNKLEIFVKTI